MLDIAGYSPKKKKSDNVTGGTPFHTKFSETGDGPKLKAL